MYRNSLSIVTLSRNQGEFIAETIESVVNQNIAKEYIVYDVGSTDDSRKIIKKNASNLISILVERDLGPSDGLNYSFEKTTGSILYYLNSDDRAIDNSFQYALQYFDKHPDCDILHGSIRIIDRSGKCVSIKPSMKFSLRGYALGYSVVYQQATFFRREIFDKTKFNVANRTCWDGEIIVDMALAGAKIHQTERILGEFRIYEESITGSGRYKSEFNLDHRRIAIKILGRDPRIYEKTLGFIFAKYLALRRRLNVLKAF